MALDMADEALTREGLVKLRGADFLPLSPSTEKQQQMEHKQGSQARYRAGCRCKACRRAGRRRPSR